MNLFFPVGPHEPKVSISHRDFDAVVDKVVVMVDIFDVSPCSAALPASLLVEMT